MITTLLEEEPVRAAEATSPAEVAGAEETARDAWERFLRARAGEAASRPLVRWRDEEGL